MPPQLRWFMRTTFMPAAKPFRAIPNMYCDSLISKAMHHDQRQRSPVFLPVTVAQHRNAGFHFDQALLSCLQVDSPRKKKCGERLRVPAEQQPRR